MLSFFPLTIYLLIECARTRTLVGKGHARVRTELQNLDEVNVAGLGALEDGVFKTTIPPDQGVVKFATHNFRTKWMKVSGAKEALLIS